MSSQELVIAQGFTQVKLNPVNSNDYGDDEVISRMSVLSLNNQNG